MTKRMRRRMHIWGIKMKRKIPFIIAALILALGLISCSNQENITSGPYVILTAGGKGLQYGKDPAGGSPGRAVLTGQGN